MFVLRPDNGGSSAKKGDFGSSLFGNSQSAQNFKFFGKLGLYYGALRAAFLYFSSSSKKTISN